MKRPPRKFVDKKDSVEKIITQYFPCVTKAAFTFKSKTYDPYPLRVSPDIFRGMICHDGCGGCCPAHTLDYLPSEPRPYKMAKRSIEFNGSVFKVYSDLQEDVKTHHCRNLDDAGRCTVHRLAGREGNPLSCDFELLRFYITRSVEAIEQGRPNRLSHAPFGRGWNLLRLDGERGALCEFTAHSALGIDEVVRKFERLKLWTDYFGLDTIIDDIVAWVKSGPHEVPVYFNQHVRAADTPLPVLRA